MTTTPHETADASVVLENTRILCALSAQWRSAAAAVGRFQHLAPGQRLFEGGTGTDALYIVRSGLLHAYEPDPPREPRVVRIIRPGEALDGLQELAGATWPVEIRAIEPSDVLVIPGPAVDQLLTDHAEFSAAREEIQRRELLCRLHRMVGPLEESLLDDLVAEAEWTQVHRDDVMFDVGAESERFYFVLSGRIAALRITESGEEVFLSERSRGDTLGEAGFLTGRHRTYRARALRDSVLVGYPAATFERLVARHPHVVRHIIASVATRIATAGREARSSTATGTLTVLAAGVRAPVPAFCERIAESLSTFGSVLRLNSARVDTLMNEPGIAQAERDTPEEQRLLAWLEGCETRHRFVICEADAEPTAWSRRCVRLADRLVLVGNARESHELNALEQALLPVVSRATDIRTTLVLLHPEESRSPSGTRYWLDARPTVTEHFHIRANASADLQRIARVMAGRGVGLVLGGGGARGFVHIGILRAFEEAGIPIDAIGGTSMGASVAAQRAMGRTPAEIAAMCRHVFLGIKPHRAFTIPIISLVSNRRPTQAARVAMGNADIEDLWLPYFCISSNLSTADAMVHRRGKLWKAAMASSMLPGVGIPVLHEGHLLVDGGVLNNLPTDVMRRHGYGTVVGAVASIEDDATFACDRIPSVWEALVARWRHAPTQRRFPSFLDVMLRASLLHSASRLRLNVEAADLSLHPGVAGFGMLDFERIDELVSIGYEHALSEIARWREGPESSLLP